MAKYCLIFQIKFFLILDKKIKFKLNSITKIKKCIRKCTLITGFYIVRSSLLYKNVLLHFSLRCENFKSTFFEETCYKSTFSKALTLFLRPNTPFTTYIHIIAVNY